MADGFYELAFNLEASVSAWSAQISKSLRRGKSNQLYIAPIDHEHW